jgi:uncharacterized membrane protein
MELWQRLGDLHPKLVQFPLVLLLSGLVFDAIGLVRRDRRFGWAAAILSGAGTVFLLVAFICGIYAEIWAGRAGVPQDAIEWHEFLANVASWGFVILTAWRLLIGDGRRRQLIAYTSIGLCFYVLLVATAYYGGQLVFSYGAAVTGGRANTVLSLHDLNTLATRQTDLNLRYSEMMHHIFGWLTLALSASLLATAAFPARARQLRWVGPALLLGGGVFLFFCADLDLYRLLDPRQLRDREVQLHKTISIVLVAVGVLGLRRRSPAPSPGTPGEGWGEGLLAPDRSPFEDPHPNPLPAYREREPERAAGSKPIAVMALIGGGLLFTHVHTVAPYANVAAGVYVAHMVLGVVALSIGAARLLQDALPRHRRPLAVAFAGLMCVESVLLITYNEGLPWYVGYGRYNRWGPHGGTVAPLGGGLRAELTFDNAEHRLDLYLLDRFTDAPAPAAATGPADLFIARGYTEVGVRLSPLANDRSHFQADAPWLADAAAFSARVSVPGGRAGFFDPWVAPLVAAVPPNEVARYQCPMHDGMLSETPGECPLCHMALVPIQVGVRRVLHDEPFGLSLDAAAEPSPAASAAGADLSPDPLQRRLTFTPRRGDQLLRDLPVVHEHPMHLTIVSSDLHSFDHVHPVPRADGSLQLDYRFPVAGHYLLFAEYMPSGERDQVFRFPVTVGDPAGAAPPPDLRPTMASAEPIPGFPAMTAELVCQPRTLSAGTHAMLLFRLSDHGQPVTDLEPYMGAMGHCAIISQDTGCFLHCHPEQLYPPHKATRGGPDIAFHTEFPTPGLYKVWGQFQRGGRIVVADFVVRVDRSLLPPRVVNFILNDN